MKSLAEFKRAMSAPGTIVTIVDYKSHGVPALHRYHNVPRVVAKAQNESVAFKDPDDSSKPASWLSYGKASQGSFDGDVATCDEGWVSLSYRVEMAR
jgi:hypothetical protein